MLTRTSTILLKGLEDTDDQSSWQVFDGRYRPLLLALGRRLGLQQADTEDVAQETMAAFLRAYRQHRYDREKGRLRDWLGGIARHKIRDLQRRQSRQELVVADKPDATRFLSQVADGHIDVVWEEEWRKGVLRQCLEEVRREVEPRTFEAFELFALRQWPAKRVADHLRVTQDVVYQSKSRILVRIRQILPQMDSIW